MKCPVSKNDENPDGSVKVNLVGRWAVWRSGGCDYGKPGGCGGLSQKEVFGTMARVKMYREECGFKYIFIGCGDHSNNAHWHNSTADPDDVDTDCSPNHIALFMLMVEEGMMIGANGWSEDYDKPLGNPLGPATNVTGPTGSTTALTRSFASGTKVTFDLETGMGHIAWAPSALKSDDSTPPPPPAPTPTVGKPDTADKPIMGFRTWNCWQFDVSQARMEAVVEAMSAPRKLWDGTSQSLIQLGYTRIGIDEGWESCRKNAAGKSRYHDAQGKPIINTDTFPDMVGLVKATNKAGAHLDWYLNNCGPCKSSPPGHIEQDVAAWAELGFGGTKVRVRLALCRVALHFVLFLVDSFQ